MPLQRRLPTSGTAGCACRSSRDSDVGGPTGGIGNPSYHHGKVDLPMSPRPEWKKLWIQHFPDWWLAIDPTLSVYLNWRFSKMCCIHLKCGSNRSIKQNIFQISQMVTYGDVIYKLPRLIVIQWLSPRGGTSSQRFASPSLQCLQPRPSLVLKNGRISWYPRSS